MSMKNEKTAILAAGALIGILASSWCSSAIPSI